MKKYNRDKRARCKANTRTQADAMRDKHTQDKHDTHDTHIHVAIKYDGYNHTQYDKPIVRHTRKSNAQRYVGMTNAINDIFPDINAPHNAHTHRANCEYHKFIPTTATPPRTAPEDLNNRISTYSDTRTVKCIIFNARDEIIYIGTLRRTIYIKRYSKYTELNDVIITLHRGDRNIQVSAYIPLVDTIHGVSIHEIRAHGVELYHI